MGQFEKGQVAWNKKQKVTLICLFCGASFEKLECQLKRPNSGKYCSRSCRASSNKPNLGNKHTKETKEKLSKILKGKEAWNKGKKGVMPIPWNKGGTFSEESKQKMSETHKGEKHSEKRRENNRKAQLGKHFLKDLSYPITPLNQIIRGSFKYRLWRESIFARDNYTCQKCGYKGGELNAHHIQNFSSVIELRTSIENGITLCEKCHREFHKIYGKKNNNKIQLKEFLFNIFQTKGQKSLKEIFR